MALKKLEENTKSLDFGQGHNGQGKNIIINLSLLLDLMITLEHWSSCLGGDSRHIRRSLHLSLLWRSFPWAWHSQQIQLFFQIGWPSMLDTANRFIISFKGLALLDLAQPTAILYFFTCSGGFSIQPTTILQFFICPGGFNIPKALHFLLDQI